MCVIVGAHRSQKRTSTPLPPIGAQVTNSCELCVIGTKPGSTGRAVCLLTAKPSHLSCLMFFTLDPEFASVSMLLKRLDDSGEPLCVLLVFCFHLHLETPLGSSKLMLPCSKKFSQTGFPGALGVSQSL